MSIERLEVLYQLERYDQLLAMAAPLQGEDAEGIQASLYSIAALMAKGEWQAAWERCVTARPACAGVDLYWYLSAKVLRHLDRLEEAQQALTQALAQQPQQPDYLCEQAVLAWLGGSVADTKHYLDRALAQQPLHPQALLYLATLYGFDLQRPDLGMQILRDYLAREPHCPDGLFLLAEMEPRLWHKAGHFRRLLSQDPFNRTAQQGLQRYGQGMSQSLWLGLLILIVTQLGVLFGEGAPWQLWLHGTTTLAALWLGSRLFVLHRQWPGIFLLGYGVVLFQSMEHGFAAIWVGMVVGGVLTLLAFIIHLLNGLAQKAWHRLAQHRNRL